DHLPVTTRAIGYDIPPPPRGGGTGFFAGSTRRASRASVICDCPAVTTGEEKYRRVVRFDLEIRTVGVEEGDHVVAEIALVVLGADHFDQRLIVDAAIALDGVPRRGEGAGSSTWTSTSMVRPSLTSLKRSMT